MNFQQLEYIVAVDQHKHFAQAADACHVTQATLSAMIKKLEQELNIVLFDRSRHPVKTTEEGAVVIEQAKNILFFRNQMLDTNITAPETLSGKLRVGIIPTVANSLLPIILPPILQNYPDLHLDIMEITTEELTQQILSGKVDVGIMATPLENTQLEENILYYEAMMIYGVTDKDKKFIHQDDIEGKKIWLLEEGNCFRDQTITICNFKEKNMEPENLTFEGNSFETLLNLADQFGGYTLVPELYFNSMAKEKKQRTKLFELPYPVREISLVFNRPYAKRRSIKVLTIEIQKLVKKHLVTSKMKPKDMRIIGL